MCLKKKGADKGESVNKTFVHFAKESDFLRRQQGAMTCLRQERDPARSVLWNGRSLWPLWTGWVRGERGWRRGCPRGPL